METHTGIMIFPLIALVGLMVGLLVLFVIVKAVRRKRWVLGTVVVLGGLCLLGGLSAVWHAAHGPVAVDMGGFEAGRYPVFGSLVVDKRSRVAQPLAETPWPVEIDPKFKPDVYPSVRSAARDLAAEVIESLPKILPGDEAPEAIEIFGRAGPDVLHAAAEALARRMPATKVRVEAVPPRSDARTGRADRKTIRVELDVPSRSTSERQTGRYLLWEDSGALGLRARGLAGELTRSARFVEKLWVANFAEFVGRNPKRRWILAQSQQPCVSQHEAEQQALEDAARKLLPAVRERLERRFGRSRLVAGTRLAEQQQRRIVGELRGEGIVVDRFAQSFLRPYGRVWRQAVLVDASDDNLERLAAVCGHQIRGHRTAWLRRAGSIGGLLLVICLVYLFLNAATKGYFIWSLRAVAVAVVIVGAFLVAMFLA